VNILVGRNNSGKSTVAEAIVRAASRMSMPGGKKEDSIGRPRSSFWRFNRKEGNASNQLQSHLWYRGESTHDIEVVLGDGRLEARYFIRGESEKHESPDGHAFVKMAPQVTAFLPYMVREREGDRNLWERLLLTRADKTLTRALARIYDLPDLEGIQQLPKGDLWLLFDQYSVPLDSLGDGTRTALRCLMLLPLLEETLFVIEEPEVHQHPGSLERFANTTIEICKERRIQLLITTHSLECVSAFVQSAAEAEIDCSLFHLMLEEGGLTARKLEADTVRSLGDAGTDVRKLDLYV